MLRSERIGRKRTSLRAQSRSHAVTSWSGRADSNRRPPAPKAGALPGCATSRACGGVYRRPDRPSARRWAPARRPSPGGPVQERGRAAPNCLPLMDATVTSYKNGRRVAEPLAVAQALGGSRDAGRVRAGSTCRRPPRTCWSRCRPTLACTRWPSKMRCDARQRPKIEQYEDFLPCVAYAAAVADQRIKSCEITGYRFMGRDFCHRRAPRRGRRPGRPAQPARPRLEGAHPLRRSALWLRPARPRRRRLLRGGRRLQDRVETLEERLV